MSEPRALALLPFVPSGNDYEASRRLFADLGFEEVWENDGYAGFRNGNAQFIRFTISRSCAVISDDERNESARVSPRRTGDERPSNGRALARVYCRTQSRTSLRAR